MPPRRKAAATTSLGGMIMTKRWVILLAVGATGLILSCPSGYAQTNISLGGSLMTISFTGVGNATQVTMSLGSLCDATHCAATGSGNAFGDIGVYSITGSPTITFTKSGGNDWNVTQSAPLSFCFSASVGCGGTVYLKGNLQLISFDQSSTGSTGVFNDNHAPNLTLTGGTLESVFGANPILDLLFNFQTSPQSPNTLLTTLLNNTNSIKGVAISSGGVDPNPTPEPATIALVGGGLLTVGTVLRRRARVRRGSRCNPAA